MAYSAGRMDQRLEREDFTLPSIEPTSAEDCRHVHKKKDKYNF